MSLAHLPVAVAFPAAVTPILDTTTAASVPPTGCVRRHHGWLVGAVIWLAVVVYGLWLATRVVRAVEKIAEKLSRP